MASQLKPAQKRPSDKYLTFADEQLRRAVQRIRLLDVTGALLGATALTLAYALTVALCDHWWVLPSLARQAGFVLYAILMIGFLTWSLILPFSRQINLYYAARRIEQTIPNAKNSVVNWIDLRGQGLPQPVETALGHRAAKDLAKANLDEAVSTRRTSWLGGLVLGLLIGLGILFLFSPRKFASLMDRAFAPFGEAPIATRTTITLLLPEGGDATVQVGQPVKIAVHVGGKVPDPRGPGALRLLYRHNPSDPYQERPLQEGDGDREWDTVLPTTHVQNGFWFRVAGGDAETREYRVQVRSTPLLTGFDVKYHFRPYLAWQDETGHDPNLRGPRGTEVELIAHTNRQVSGGQISLENGLPISSELLADDPQALRFRLTLEKDGKYRVWFTSRQGERNTDPMPYTIHVQPDHAPKVSLTKPGNVTLPANGVLRPEGSASDDFGLTVMELKMQVENGPGLRPKRYREGKSFRLANGKYPQTLEYQDFVELDHVKVESGADYVLQPGTVVKYWLEATDNCDYPAPNVGKSEEFTITIAAQPLDNKRSQQHKVEASKEQQQHEKKQDERLNEEGQKKDERQGDGSSSHKNKGQQGGKGDKENPDQGAAGQKDSGQKQDSGSSEKGDSGQKSDPGQAGTDSKSQQDKGQSAGGIPDNKKEKQGIPDSAKDQGNQDRKDQELNKQADTLKQAMQEAQKSKQGEGQSKERDPSGAEKEQPKGGKQDQSKPGDNSAKEGDQPKNKDAGNSEGSPKKGGSQNKTADRDKQGGKDPKSGDKQKGKDPKSGDKQGAKDSHSSERPGNEGKSGSEKDKTGQDPKGSNSGADRKQPGDDLGKKDDRGQTQPEGAKKEGESSKDSTGGEKQSPGDDQPGTKKDKTNDGSRGGQKGKDDSSKEGGMEKENGKDSKDKEKQSGSKEGTPKKDGPSGGQPEPKNGNQEKKGDQEKKGGNRSREASSAGEKDSPNSPKDGREPSPGEMPPQSGKGQPKKEQAKPGDKRSEQSPEKKSPGKSTEKSSSEAPGQIKGEEKSKEGDPSKDQGSTPMPGDEGAKSDQGSKPNKEPGAKDTDTHRPDGKTDTGETGSKSANPGAKTDSNSTRKEGQEKPGDLNSGGPKKEGELPTKPEGSPRPGKDAPKQDSAPSKQDKDGTGEKGGGQDKQGSKPGAEKGKNGQPSPKSSEPAQPGNQKDKEGGKSQGKSDPAKSDPNSTPSGKGSEKKSSGSASREGGEQPNQNPSNPGGRPDPDTSEPDPPEPEAGSPDNPEHLKKAGALQLEDFKKRVTKDVLKEAKMSDEDFQKFLKDYEAMLRRQGALDRNPEKIGAPLRGGGNLPNQKAQRVVPGTQVNPGQLQRGGQALPPPEFREVHKEFSRRLSELEKLREKK